MSDSRPILRIANWSELQHYKSGRGITWIKVYLALSQSYRWTHLLDYQRGQLVGLWLLAARDEGQIMCDPDWIARQISATEPLALPVFVADGWLMPNEAAQVILARYYPGDASKLLASCYQVAIERREEKREKNTRASARAADAESDEAFEDLWSRYPRKRGKIAARRHYRTSVHNGEDLAAIRQALDNARAEFSSTDPTFIPHGSTWFSNWRDYVDSAAPHGVTLPASGRPLEVAI